MALTKVEVLGLREASDAFRRLPKIAKDAFNVATLTTVQVLSAQAADKAPVGKTGALKRAIGWSMNNATGQGKVGIRLGFDVVRAGRNGSALTANGAFKHSPTKIGHLVEFGHGGPGRAAAHPFLRPALEREQNDYLLRCRKAGAQIERDMSSIGGRLL